jgi:hypothetical protein
MFLHLSLVSLKTLGVVFTLELIVVKKEYFFVAETLCVWLNFAVAALMGFIINSIVAK